jgi:hypothetical protein
MSGRAAALLAASAIALATADAAVPAPSASVITVKAPTLIRLAGTDIFCTVGTAGTTVAVACAHFPRGPAKAPRGRAIVSSDALVAVEDAATTKPIKTARNPASLAAVSPLTGGAAHRKPITLGLHQGAYVSGSRMTMLVEPARGGGNAIGVIFLNAHAAPVPGTYSVGISNHYVTIIKVTAAGAPSVFYEKPVF